MYMACIGGAAHRIKDILPHSRPGPPNTREPDVWFTMLFQVHLSGPMRTCVGLCLLVDIFLQNAGVC